MFEGEGDKKKKVYPHLPDVWGKKDTPYYIYCMMHLLKRPMHHFSYKDLLHHFLSILDNDTVIAGINLLTIDVE